VKQVAAMMFDDGRLAAAVKGWHYGPRSALELLDG
jgi:hypothetical protein